MRLAKNKMNEKEEFLILLLKSSKRSKRFKNTVRYRVLHLHRDAFTSQQSQNRWFNLFKFCTCAQDKNLCQKKKI